MKIKISNIQRIASKIFDLGYSNHPDQAEQLIIEILNENGIENVPEPEIDKNFKVYHVDELLGLPAGTKFEHEICGECVIKQNGTKKYMSFVDAEFSPAGFGSMEYPWDVPMRMISLGEEE